jgi:hypothetical protein
LIARDSDVRNGDAISLVAVAAAPCSSIASNSALLQSNFSLETTIMQADPSLGDEDLI